MLSAVNNFYPVTLLLLSKPEIFSAYKLTIHSQNAFILSKIELPDSLIELTPQSRCAGREKALRQAGLDTPGSAVTWTNGHKWMNAWLKVAD